MPKCRFTGSLLTLVTTVRILVARTWVADVADPRLLTNTREYRREPAVFPPSQYTLCTGMVFPFGCVTAKAEEEINRVNRKGVQVFIAKNSLREELVPRH